VAANRRGTTLRLEVSIHDQLDNAAHILRKTKAGIVEEALQDYFEKHDICSVYQLTLTKSNVVLMRMDDPPRILEVEERNGVSPDKVVQTYSKKLQSPVRLVVQED
jgi:hypothetical protein